ncbi:MAG: hypothetical protein Crog4KO_26450 [Crocinitomicaceae bacterium]
MKNVLFTLLLATTVLLTSCLKEEIPVNHPTAGSTIINSFDMGVDYRYNAYYDFETNSFVKEHLKTDWDIGFETGANGWRLVLNTSKAMAAAESQASSFATTTDTIGAIWRHDASSWNLDSTAIGDWQSYNGVYIIDRGYSYDGTHTGFRKFEIQSVDADYYTVRYAALDGSDESTVQIPKSDDSYNFTFYSFETNNVADIEPQKADWDIVFRQYTHIFDGHTPYLVNGILSNSNTVEVAEVFHKTFEDVIFEDITTAEFSSANDIIGYDWKTFTGNEFEIHPEQVYIVKTTEGLYYKLRFIDFYNSQGDKGTPTFETAAL